MPTIRLMLPRLRLFWAVCLVAEVVAVASVVFQGVASEAVVPVAVAPREVGDGSFLIHDS